MPERTTFNLHRMTEAEARAYLEAIRWPEGAFCPHCGSVNVKRLEGKAAARGVYKCREKECRKQFTVTVGTVFERSHIPLAHWVYAITSMCASKKGISALQLSRELGITYKSAWFMCHRVRYMMNRDPMRTMLKGVVEADETYVGGKARNRNREAKPSNKRGRGAPNKTPVAAVVERGGEVRARVVTDVTAESLGAVLRDNVDTSAILMTDDHRPYRSIGREFARHRIVRHSHGEYVRKDRAGEPTITTNTIEGFFSILKRGVMGTFHNISRQHLPRYLDEFTFRYNARKISDAERTAKAIKGAEGKRLTYRQPRATALVARHARLEKPSKRA